MSLCNRMDKEIGQQNLMLSLCDNINRHVWVVTCKRNYRYNSPMTLVMQGLLLPSFSIILLHNSTNDKQRTVKFAEPSDHQ